MRDRLKPYSKKKLESLALGLMPPLGRRRLPRLFPRLRRAAICWFCQWAPDFAGHIGADPQDQELAGEGDLEDAENPLVDATANVWEEEASWEVDWYDESPSK
jgi:hypothetical protein